MRPARLVAVLAALLATVPFAGTRSAASVDARSITVESHHVRVTTQPKLCPARGFCTLALKVLRRKLPVHRGSSVVIRTRKPVARVRLLRADQVRSYAAGRPSARKTAWTFRIPRSERIPLLDGEERVREVFLAIDYGDGTVGSIALFLAPHLHRPFTPPPIAFETATGVVRARPRFCTWADSCARASSRPVQLDVSPARRVVLRFGTPVAWTRVWDGDGPEYAPVRRAGPATWSFVASRLPLPRWVEVEVAYPQGRGVLRVRLV